MLDPKRENKNGTGDRKPWSIKSFPVKLRRQLASEAAKEGTTIQGKLEDVVETHLKGAKKK